jgi:hypothetical protein
MLFFFLVGSKEDIQGSSSRSTHYELAELTSYMVSLKNLKQAQLFSRLTAHIKQISILEKREPQVNKGHEQRSFRGY